MGGIGGGNVLFDGATTVASRALRLSRVAGDRIGCTLGQYGHIISASRAVHAISAPHSPNTLHTTERQCDRPVRPSLQCATCALKQYAFRHCSFTEVSVGDKAWPYQQDIIVSYHRPLEIMVGVSMHRQGT